MTLNREDYKKRWGPRGGNFRYGCKAGLYRATSFWRLLALVVKRRMKNWIRNGRFKD